MPSKQVNPPCPACGSSATLPFENEESARVEQTFSEMILTILLLFLVLLIVFLLFLLSHASLPISLLIGLTFFMLWQQKKKRRPPHRRHGQYVCLDCSSNFKA